MPGGRAPVTASWFHWGCFREDGKRRTSARRVTSWARSIRTTPSNSRVEWPRVRMRYGRATGPASHLRQGPALVQGDVAGPVAPDLVLGIVRRAVVGVAL